MAKRSTRKKPPLFNLPPELRNAIYELVLDEPWQAIRIPYSRPPLLQVCKQITSEASPFFCGTNDFYAYLTTADIVTFTQCLQAMGANGGKCVLRLTLSLDIESEAEMQRTSRFGGAGVLNYPSWRWADVPRAVLDAEIRQEVVAIKEPLARGWTEDLVKYADRWEMNMRRGLSKET